jgi:hypothetical protein
MKLTYRGVAYTLPSATVHLNSSQTLVGKYRGATCLIEQFTLPSAGRINLKYRGAYYYPGSVYPTNPGLAAA